MKVATGQYTGTGSDTTITGVGFTPALVIIKNHTSSGFARWYTSTMASNDSAYFVAAGNDAGAIKALNTDGFSLGTSSNVNASGSLYNWIAFAADGSDDFKVGEYTGNDNDNRSITGVGFQPDFLFIKAEDSRPAIYRHKDFAADHGDYGDY
ncbi:MAG: hypothetical protein KJI69_05820, partial [Patescibacteria group bacterium]|nr:hypothetical protein [Patescibacteria group bacterium]